MKRLAWRVWLGYLLIFLSLLLLLWGLYPFEHKRREIRIQPQGMQTPAIYEVFPDAIRWG